MTTARKTSNNGNCKSMRMMMMEDMNDEECVYLKLEDHPDDDDDTTTTTSSSSDEAGTMSMPLFGAFKSHSLIIGLLVGFFVQFSTLGANFLVIALWENDIMTRSRTEIILLSLLWSAFTSFMAILTLGFLRSVVTIVFRASLPNNNNTNSENNHTEAILEEVILHLECRFVVGALIGVCLAWTVTDVLLGMNIQIIFSLVTLIISLAWCKLMMYCFTKDEKSYINENGDLMMIHNNNKSKKNNEPTPILLV